MHLNDWPQKNAKKRKEFQLKKTHQPYLTPALFLPFCGPERELKEKL
jgi:hypothetical protein